MEVLKMREILFRGKRLDNGEWVNGYLFTGLFSSQAIETPGTDDFEDVDPATVGQYTGLTDKNGAKIFEGDICRLIHDWHNGTTGEWCAVVEFGNPNSTYSWGWQLKRISGEMFVPAILLWVDMEETGATCEVIGNIHDNPELLEGGAGNA